MNKIIIKATAAILVFNQAVFLLFPIGTVSAQILSDPSLRTAPINNYLNTTSTQPSTYDYASDDYASEEPSTQTYIDPGTRNIIQPDSTINPDASTGDVLYNLEPITTTDISFTFMEALKSPFSQSQPLTILLNQEVDKVVIYISGPKSEYLHPGSVAADKLHYYFVWDTTGFPDGFYKIIATASKGSDSFTKSFTTEVKNDFTDTIEPVPFLAPERVVATSSVISPTSTTSPTFVSAGISIVKPAGNSTVSGWSPIVAESRGKIKAVEFRIVNNGQERILGIGNSDSSGTIWKGGFESGNFSNGDYEIFAHALDYAGARIKSNKILIHVSNPVKEGPLNSLPPVSPTERLAPEKSDYYVAPQPFPAPIMRPENEYNFFPDNTMKPGEVPLPPTEQKEVILGIPWECRKANISDAAKCDSHMFSLYAPDECKRAGALTHEECDKIMMVEKMPPECRGAGITSKEECEKHLTIKHMPADCAAASITDERECDKFLFKKYAPQKCKEAGAESEKECEKLLFKESAPSDCKEAGIENMEACEKYIFDKYGGFENVPLAKFPPDCVKAGAKTSDECEKVMNKIYLPKECSDQGLTDEKRCRDYLTQKNMPEECRQANAKTREECDKVMFNKFAPEECTSNGIEDSKKCEEYMLAKYKPVVNCRGIEDNQCERYIKDRHLGSIVAKQTQFEKLKKIKEDVVPAADTAPAKAAPSTIKELEDALGDSKNIIPIKKGERGIRIVSSNESVVLDEKENLIQTPPIVLMMDADRDGLPDDMEKRLGTNPNNADTDGDGYMDGVEIKNNYNASGEGKATNIISPIDEAILQNKSLDHPKTEGEETEDFTVDNFSNISEEANGEGYNFSGSADPESTVTIYIYSDLPLVVTTKVDRYGNWEYELNESLAEGEHEVYVVLNDNTGKVLKKSSPLNFFIKEAKAVSVDDFIGTASIPSAASASERATNYYFTVLAVSIGAGILLFVAIIIQKKKSA